jgi:hypothetical protein
MAAGKALSVDQAFITARRASRAFPYKQSQQSARQSHLTRGVTHGLHEDDDLQFERTQSTTLPLGYHPPKYDWSEKNKISTQHCSLPTPRPQISRRHPNNYERAEDAEYNQSKAPDLHGDMLRKQKVVRRFEMYRPRILAHAFEEPDTTLHHSVHGRPSNHDASEKGNTIGEALPNVGVDNLAPPLRRSPKEQINLRTITVEHLLCLGSVSAKQTPR